MRRPDDQGHVELHLALSPRRVVGVLAAVAAAFVITSLVLRLSYVNGRLTSFGFTINEVLNVDAERNPPTWTQAATMLACGGLSWVIAQRTALRGWQLISLFFVAISMDEAARLHENLIGPLQRLLGTEGTILHYAWVVPAVPMVAVFAYLVRGALRAIPRRERLALVAAGAAFFAGSIGMEVVGGWAVAEGVDTTRYVVVTHLEEALESMGLVGAFAVLLELAGQERVPTVAPRRRLVTNAT